MKKIIFAVLFLFTSLLSAQSQFQEFINHVNSLGDPIAKQTAVDSFMTYGRTIGMPFIEDSTANFIYLGNPSTITVAGDFNGWSTTAWPMTRLTQTNFWYRSENFEMDARLDYAYVLNGSSWIFDPENPPGSYINSELSMPLYVQPWEINYNPNIAHGTVVTKTIFSTIVGSYYQLNIYLPPGYDSLASTNYPTVYFHDGSGYINIGKANNVIDNLLDSLKIQPVIGVFVNPNNRDLEYAGSLRNQYRLFFVNELVPNIDANYKTKVDPKERLVMGLSYGGNISALISYNHPEVFGLCGLQSAQFAPNNYEAYFLIVNGPVKDIKWSSIWGTYEGLYVIMRLLRDYLIGASYELDWLERPEGHSWGLWRATVDRMLEYFFPADPSNNVNDGENNIVSGFVLYQNYPNPFNPSTTIGYVHQEKSSTKLTVMNAIGEEIAVLVNEEQDKGFHKVDFNASNIPSGVYFYQLRAGDYTLVKKMILLK